MPRDQNACKERCDWDRQISGPIFHVALACACASASGAVLAVPSFALHALSRGLGASRVSCRTAAVQ